jgi:hypothetical protein
MHEIPEYLTLTQATKLSPGRPSTNCIWRWCRRGVLSRGGRRVRLRHVRIGGKIYTTAEWLNDFGQRLADADAAYFDIEAETAASVPERYSRKREERELQALERQLEEAGA